MIQEIIKFLYLRKNQFLIMIACFIIIYIGKYFNLEFIEVGNFKLSLDVLRFLLLCLGVLVGIFWIWNVIIVGIIWKLIKHIGYHICVYLPMKKTLNELPQNEKEYLLEHLQSHDKDVRNYDLENKILYRWHQLGIIKRGTREWSCITDAAWDALHDI